MGSFNLVVTSFVLTSLSIRNDLFIFHCITDIDGIFTAGGVNFLS